MGEEIHKISVKKNEPYGYTTVCYWPYFLTRLFMLLFLGKEIQSEMYLYVKYLCLEIVKGSVAQKWNDLISKPGK